MRNSTERPEVLDKDTIVIGGYTAETLLQTTAMAMDLFDGEDRRPVDYGDVNVAAKVVRIIRATHTDNK